MEEWEPKLTQSGSTGWLSCNYVALPLFFVKERSKNQLILETGTKGRLIARPFRMAS